MAETPAMQNMKDTIADDMRDLYHSLRDHILLILFIAGLVVAAAFYMVASMPDRYTAIALVMLDPGDMQPGASLRKQDLALPDEDRALLSEIEILRSRQVADKVINALNLTADPEYNANLEQPPRSARFAAWLKEKLDGGSLEPIAAWAGRIEDAGAKKPIQTAELTDTTDAPMLDLGKSGPGGTAPAEVYRAFGKALGTQIRGGSSVVEISFKSIDPALAAKAANAVVDVYFGLRQQSDASAAGDANKWLNARIEKMQGELRALEAELAGNRTAAGVMPQGDADLISRQVEQMTDNMTAASAKQAQLEARQGQVQVALAQGNYQSLGDLVDTPEMAELKLQLSERAATVRQLRTSLAPRHPRLIAAEAELASIKERVADAAHAYVRGLDREVIANAREAKSLKERITDLRGELRGSSQNRASLAALEREIDAKREMLKSLMEQQTKLNLFEDKRAVPTDLRLISPAETPQEPSSPRRALLMAAAAAVGLALGAGAALLVDITTSRLMHRSQVKAIARKVRIIGYSPPLGRRWRRWLPFGRREGTPPIYDEAVRRLLSSLRLELRQEEDGGGRAVLITSSQPGEGKTTTARELAEAAAAGGHQVLLVNCDPKGVIEPRGPQFEPAFSLIDLLREGKSPELAIMAVPEVENLYHLPSGKISESSLPMLGGAAMKKLLNTLRQRFDLVVLDAPPVLALSYVLPLGEMADMVLYLGRWRRVRMRDALSGIKSYREYEVPVVFALTALPHNVALKVGLRPIHNYYRDYMRQRASA